jgi:hypothetical protein
MAKRLNDEEAMQKNTNSPLSPITDFSYFKFTNTRTKAKYFCKIHNLIFETQPTCFWLGRGCPKCGQLKRTEGSKKNYKMKIRKSNFQVISEFEKIHGPGKYDYSKVNYTKNNIKVPIQCNNPNHGVFLQTPNKHLLGRGCPLCANETRNDNSKRSLQDFIDASNKIHNNFYDYSESVYLGALSFIDIICPRHGKFSQKVFDHTQGHGCRYCSTDKNAARQFKTTEDIVKRCIEVHGDFYDYSKVDYKGIFKHITIVCPVHKEFNQVVNAHVNGAGCPICNKSRGELLIAKILDRNGIKYKDQYKFQECKFKQPLPFDFYLFEHSICIEYQGEQHYIEKVHWGGKKAYEYLVNNDNIKKVYCSQNKIGLIQIPYKIAKEEIEIFLLNQMEEIKLKLGKGTNENIL